MAIAKVEPLTTARALRGPFDYVLPERLGEVGVGTLLEVPFGRQRLLGVVVELAEHSEVPPERLVEPIAALEAGRLRELVELGLWVAQEYCSTAGPRRSSSCCRPGPARPAGSRAPAPSCVARPRRGAARALEAGGLGRSSGARSSCSTRDGAELGAGELAAQGVGRDALRRLERRGLVELGEREVRRRPRAAAIGAGGRRRGAPLDRVAARDARSTASSPRSSERAGRG